MYFITAKRFGMWEEIARIDDSVDYAIVEAMAKAISVRPDIADGVALFDDEDNDLWSNYEDDE